MQKFYKVHGLMSNYGKSSGILMSHLTLIKKMICYVLVSLSHTLLRLVKLDEKGFPSLVCVGFQRLLSFFLYTKKTLTTGTYNPISVRMVWCFVFLGFLNCRIWIPKTYFEKDILAIKVIIDWVTIRSLFLIRFVALLKNCASRLST